MPSTAPVSFPHKVRRYRVMVGDNIIPAESLREVAAIIETAALYEVEAHPRAVQRDGWSRPLTAAESKEVGL